MSGWSSCLNPPNRSMQPPRSYMLSRRSIHGNCRNRPSNCRSTPRTSARWRASRRFMSTGFPTLRAATSKRIAKAACGIAVLSILLAGAALVSRGQWGDQGDGSYANPVLPGDFSDLDAIRVGTNFYAISSTFQYSPGIVLLHSKNLVNWQIIGHVIPDITRIGADLNWDKMDRAGRGVWAGAIRFHAGKYWVYFGT